MIIYPDWNLSILFPIYLKDETKELIDYLDNKYDLNFKIPRKEFNPEIYNLGKLKLDSKIKNVAFTINPLERIYNLYNKINNNQIPKFKNLKKLSFEEFINFLVKNRENIFNEYESRQENKKLLQYFYPLLWSYSNYDSLVNELDEPNIDIFLEINSYIGELKNILLSIDENLFNDFEKLFSKKVIENTSNYIIYYNKKLIEQVYSLYHQDFDKFNLPIHNSPKMPLLLKNNRKPLITIITPTLGNTSIINLISALKSEDIPYIHLILFDNNRVVNSIKPSDIEDKEITFCYEFNHPHLLPKQNQRNDVWLRAVGISLANTEYVTFFDDDTWPQRNHLSKIISFMEEKKYDYTFCKRQMWEKTGLKKLKLIGTDNFEAIGVMNKDGYRLIDNSSLYMNIKTARMLAPTYLNNQVYGDDRLTPDVLDANAIGGQLDKVLVNHIAKSSLVNYFKKNIC